MFVHTYLSIYREGVYITATEASARVGKSDTLPGKRVVCNGMTNDNNAGALINSGFRSRRSSFPSLLLLLQFRVSARSSLMTPVANDYT